MLAWYGMNHSKLVLLCLGPLFPHESVNPVGVIDYFFLCFFSFIT